MRPVSLRRLVILLSALTLLAGCARETRSPRESGKVRLAFISNNPYEFWTFAEAGTKKAAADLGIEVEFKKPPKGSAEEQQEIIEDLLVRGIQGIAISPNDSANMVDFFRSKVSNRVPLVMVDNDVPDPKVRRAYVGTHNYRAGRAAGEMLAKAVPEGGKFVIFVGKMDAQNAIERRQGVLDFLADVKQDEIKELTPADVRDRKFGKYVLVDTRTDDTSETVCQARAEDLFANHNDIAAVVGLWAYNPPALLRAAEKMKAKAKIIAFDEYEETLNGVRDGKIVGTIVQAPFEFGNQSMRILAGLVKKDDSVLKSYKGIDAENRVFIPHRLITKENVVDFHAEVRKMLGK